MDSSRPEYEYSYRFWVDEAIIPRAIRDDDVVKLLFAFQTNFTLKIRRPITDGDDHDHHDDMVIMGSESCTKLCMDSDVEEQFLQNQNVILENHTSNRLKEYRIIPDDVIPRLVNEALDFARQKAADPQNASLLIIPVVVCIDICTVMQEREPLDAAMDRAIRGEGLTTSRDWHSTGQHIDEELWYFLKNSLPRVRVEDVDHGLSLMEECPVCLNNPTVGTVISLLPSCGHAFHFHCVVSWLVKSNLCPMCRRRVHDVSIFYSSSDSDSGSRSDSDSDSDSGSDSDDDSVRRPRFQLHTV